MQNIQPPPKAIELFSIGLELHQIGKLDEAEKYYKAALMKHALFIDALHFLGVIAAQKNQFEAAIALIDQAIAISPNHEGALTNRGLALHRLGQYDAALKDFEHAISVNEHNAQNYYNRGNTLQELKQYEAALQSYDKAIAIDPLNNNVHYNRGNTLQELKQYEAALQSYDKAIAIDPLNAEAFNGRGDCFYELGDITAAKYCYKKAIKLNPGLIQARLGVPTSNIPKIFSSTDNPEQLRLELNKDLDELKAWSAFNKIPDGHLFVGCHQPYYLAYQDTSNLEILVKYGEISQSLMRSFPGITAKKLGNPNPIQIGIVSSHLHSHSVWNAITKGFVENLDREIFDLHFFDLGSYEDNETEIAKNLSKSFTHKCMSLFEWSEEIVNKGIEVLIYPEIGMHQLTSQLANLRLAPLQLAFWGHPETTGLKTIDHFISANDLEGPQAEANYSEKLLKLNNLGSYCMPYTGQVTPPDLKLLGINDAKPMLICSGSPFKYQPQHDHIFIEIAQIHQNCQFIFFDFPNCPTKILMDRLKNEFKKANLMFDEHIKLLPLLKPEKFYGLLSKVDIFMDTVGFSGFNTALQAIECNLPIVTIEGEFMRGRLASGILKRLGMLDLIAANKAEYVNTVNKLITDRVYNLKIRDRIKKSKAILFMDLSPINDFEKFLIAQCRSK